MTMTARGAPPLPSIPAAFRGLAGTTFDGLRLRAVMVHVVAPLACGTAIYVVRRSNNLVLRAWMPELARTASFEGLGAATAALRDALPGWVLFNLPDGLWAYALTAGLALTWRSGPRRVRTAWLGFALVLAVGFELAQLFGVFPGTFDVRDLVASCAAWSAACWAFSSEREPSR